MNVTLHSTPPGGLVVRNTPDAAIVSAWVAGREICVTLNPAQREAVASLLRSPAEKSLQFVGNAVEFNAPHL